MNIDISYIAYHEAGHAVVGRLLRHRDDRVSIKPDEGSRGRAIFDPALGTSFDLPEFVNPDSYWRACIMTAFAGVESEIHFLGSSPALEAGLLWDDLDATVLWSEELSFPPMQRGKWESYEHFVEHQRRKLREKTRLVIRRNAIVISELAQALIEREVLRGDEVDKIVFPLSRRVSHSEHEGQAYVR